MVVQGTLALALARFVLNGLIDDRREDGMSVVTYKMGLHDSYDLSPIAICMEEHIVFLVDIKSIKQMEILCSLNSSRGSVQCLVFEFEKVTIIVC